LKAGELPFKWEPMTEVDGAVVVVALLRPNDPNDELMDFPLIMENNSLVDGDVERDDNCADF
jgi:hypothetical protein